MSDELLRPYSIYLPQTLINKLKHLSKSRRASTFIREALLTAMDTSDEFTSGYNKGLREACRVIQDSKEATMIAFHGKDLSSILIEQIKMLEENGK